MTHIAHFNWATMRGAIDDPVMSEFASAVGTINTLAERSPGFIWRHGNEASAVQDIGWPLFTDTDRVIASFSVWESVEALEYFTFNTLHGAFYRRGKVWFEDKLTVNYCLWSIQAGHQPDIAEAQDRASHILRHGPTDYSFDFSWKRQAIAG